MSTVTSNGTDPSPPSFIRSGRSQLSSVRFAFDILGNIGASLRDNSSEDEAEDNEDTERIETSHDPSRTDEEMQIVESTSLSGVHEVSTHGA